MLFSSASNRKISFRIYSYLWGDCGCAGLATVDKIVVVSHLMSCWGGKGVTVRDLS